jgi:tellurite resistance protein TerC
MVDLCIAHKKAHEVKPLEAAIWSTIWIGTALAFNYFLYLHKGPTTALEFLTGYLIEKALSLDNVFVILLIFSSFSIPLKYQHRVLFWGVLGALVMRGFMILVGTSLLRHFHWIIYVFGAFLIYSAVQTFLHQTSDKDVTSNPFLELMEKYIPLSRKIDGQKFYTRIQGKIKMTPLFLVLILIEFSDLMFAVDSIPAILAITHDPFIVYTSNIFAILGLRSLYFLISHWVKKLHYIRHGLSVILGFVGLKMLLMDVYQIPIIASLGIIGSVLVITIIASMLRPAPPDSREI